ncbi:PH domain-containing protein [Streptomyces sp. NPDC058625]|uniref:PH domain-containing protein n=1 Tax=Streptomyces sp. NPDC058625 TaxID=3346564 RepID=UPI003651E26F
MSDAREVTCRSQWSGALWFLVGFGATGAASAVLLRALMGLAVWPVAAVLSAVAAVAAMDRATAWVRADARGVHSRTLLRRRSVRWSDVADLRVRLKYANTPRTQDVRRIVVVLREGQDGNDGRGRGRGRKWTLPLPVGLTSHDPDFDEKLEVFRALHRRHGTPESSHLAVISYRTTGRGWIGSLVVSVLLLALAGAAAAFVLAADADLRAWKSAVPCTAGASAAERRETCVTTMPAVIERTEAHHPRKGSRLYFTDARPLERLGVSEEAARAFRAGDGVELTVWRGSVKEVAGERHVWREHTVTPGSVAVAAAVVALVAGYPAARVLVRIRRRRRPEDEVLPSVLPFVAVLFGTALWLLPLCSLHPTTLFTSPLTTFWPVAGALVSLVLFAWAWRVTRFRGPEESGSGRAAPSAGRDDDEKEVFLRARFLEVADYNPRRFGTHVVLGGDGPPSVTPHPGPGRFVARPIPVGRLALRKVRPVRGGDGDGVPGAWHIAELDDAGTPVRLAAAPADLNRILRHLTPGQAPGLSAEAAAVGRFTP